MRRLYLVRHGLTGATCRGAFPDDEPLASADLHNAQGLHRHLRYVEEAYVSPSLRARQTAAAAGFEPVEEPALAECDFGEWRGRSLAEVYAQDPDGAAVWMSDPRARPHGGESLAALAARIGGWLEEQAALEGSAVAFTHGGPIRAAIVHTLGAPLTAFWQIEIEPLAIAELRAHEGRWLVARANWRPKLKARRPVSKPEAVPV